MTRLMCVAVMLSKRRCFVILCGLVVVCCCFRVSALWRSHYGNTEPHFSVYEKDKDKHRGSVRKFPQWSVKVPSRHPDEVKHIVFVKVHKAASTTIYSLLIRFALSRDLNVMFPKTGNILSLKRPVLNPIVAHPPSPPFRFDILCNHVVFRAEQIRPWFPSDTKFIAILRRPWEHMVSAFHYFRDVEKFPYLMKAQNFTQFLLNRSTFEPSDPLESLTNNRMSLDLGLPPGQLRNSSYIPTFIGHLQDTFHLVLIAERFDESLVLLKRRFGWTTKDIIYAKLNTFKKPATAFNEGHPQLRAEFLRFNRFDVAVYDHFLAVFVQEVERQRPEFDQELSVFSTIEKNVLDFCSSNRSSLSVLNISQTPWNEAFTVEKVECEVLSMKELTLNSLARERQLSRQKERATRRQFL